MTVAKVIRYTTKPDVRMRTRALFVKCSPSWLPPDQVKLRRRPS
jgi:hypothetical protein